MIDILHTDNKNILIVVCSDGQVMIDRRVYEQKLGTLISCQTKKEVDQLANSCYSYLKDQYGQRIRRPRYL